MTLPFALGEDGTIGYCHTFDAATRSASSGRPVEVIDGAFVLEQELSIGTSRTSKRIEGTFVASDKVEGTFEFYCSSLGTFEGEWEGAPAQ